MGGGFFNVPAEKVAKLKVATVCLEHGKDEPRPAIPYEIKPLEQVSSDPRVAEVLKQFSHGKSTQRVAQIAAWHLANNMSWQQLAEKHIEHLNGQVEPYFAADEIRAAMALVNTASDLAKQAPRKGDSLTGKESPEAEYEIKY
jgi:hypothetical protein